MTRSARIAARVQDDVVVTYRDAFGFPRLEQPREPRIGALAFLLGLGAVLSASVLVFLVTR